ncbi:MAG: hypothetical protein JWN49_718 [Parcubacteria group bacterium]|nr:hypothetical protein [Parcubacteria group bacterium]
MRDTTKPTATVMGLPNNLSESRLREIHDETVSAFARIPGTGVANECNLLTFFPSDMLQYGLGDEIHIEVTLPMFSSDQVKATRGRITCQRLSDELSNVFFRLFPDAYNQVHVTPLNSMSGTTSAGTLGAT